MKTHFIVVLLFQLAVPALFQIFKCDFENGFCSWTQGIKSSTAWVIGQVTPYEKCAYATVQAFRPGNKTHESAAMVSPIISTEYQCLSLRYQIIGIPKGLVIYLMQNERFVPKLIISGTNPKHWTSVTLPVLSTSAYQIVIEAHLNPSSWNAIGIDDIVITKGPCMEIFRQHQMKSDYMPVLHEEQSEPEPMECMPPDFQVDTKCFHLIHRRKSQQMAEKTCKELGGQIAMITSDNVMKAVVSKVKELQKSVWIDGHYDRVKKVWLVDSKQNIMHIPKHWWLKGEPNNWRRAEEDCLMVRMQGGLNDAVCSKRILFLCENLSMTEMS